MVLAEIIRPCKDGLPLVADCDAGTDKTPAPAPSCATGFRSPTADLAPEAPIHVIDRHGLTGSACLRIIGAPGA